MTDRWGGQVGWSITSARSIDVDLNILLAAVVEEAEMLVSLLDYKSLESLTSIAPFTTDIPTYHIMTLGNWIGLGGQYGQVVGVILLFSWSRSAQGDHGV